MLTLEQIVAGLTDRNLAAVAEKSGVNYQTVYQIATGKQTNPRYQTLKKLNEYLEKENDKIRL